MRFKKGIKKGVLGVFLMLVVFWGCSKENNNKILLLAQQPGDFQSSMTAHEFILEEYHKVYDDSHYKSVLEENKNAFVVNGEVDYQLAAKFLIENKDLFVDTLAYNNVVELARVKYDIEPDFYIPTIASQETIEMFVDYDGSHNGYNFLNKERKITFAEIKRCYANELKPLLSEEEWLHCNDLLEFSLTETGSYADYISFLEYSIDNASSSYSLFYLDFLDFALHTAKYYSSLEDAALYGIESDYTDAMAYAQVYSALRPRCTSCGVLEMISHSQHISQSNAAVAGPSSTIKWLCFVSQFIS